MKKILFYTVLTLYGAGIYASQKPDQKSEKPDTKTTLAEEQAAALKKQAAQREEISRKSKSDTKTSDEGSSGGRPAIGAPAGTSNEGSSGGRPAIEAPVSSSALQIPHTIKQGDQAVDALSFLPNGMELLSQSGGVMKLWNVHKFNLVYAFDKLDTKKSIVAVSPNGDYIASALKNKVFIFNGQTRKIFKILEGKTGDETDEIKSIAFSYNNKFLAAGFRSSALRIWQLEQPESNSKENQNPQALRASLSAVEAMCYLPEQDDQYLVMGFSAGKAILLDIANHEILQTLDHKSAVMSVVYSQNNKYLATGSFDGTVKVWNVKMVSKPAGTDPEKKPRVERKEIPQMDLVKKLELTREVITTKKQEIIVDKKKVIIPEEKEVTPLKVVKVVFSLSDKQPQLAAVCLDGTVLIWDITRNWDKLTLGLDNTNIASLAYSQNNQYIAVGKNNGDIIIQYNPAIIKVQKDIEFKRMQEAEAKRKKEQAIELQKMHIKQRAQKIESQFTDLKNKFIEIRDNKFVFNPETYYGDELAKLIPEFTALRNSMTLEKDLKDENILVLVLAIGEFFEEVTKFIKTKNAPAVTSKISALKNDVITVVNKAMGF